MNTKNIQGELNTRVFLNSEAVNELLDLIMLSSSLGPACRHESLLFYVRGLFCFFSSVFSIGLLVLCLASLIIMYFCAS